MKKIVTTLLIVCLISLSSCKNEKKIEGPTQMEQVMEIHDEVMPKMGTIGKLVGQLKPMADSLGMESAEAKAMKDLQEANKSMMDWMQEFGDKFDSEEILDGKELSKEKVQLLNEEEQKIEAVKEAINSSISRAEELLKN
ncbi:MAG: hypothetical protein WBB24_08465 [Maribacter sp.]